MIAELHQEREGIEQAILVLERLAAGQGKRRGRPPAWMSAMKTLVEEESTHVIVGRHGTEIPMRARDPNS